MIPLDLRHAETIERLERENAQLRAKVQKLEGRINGRKTTAAAQPRAEPCPTTNRAE